MLTPERLEEPGFELVPLDEALADAEEPAATVDDLAARMLDQHRIVQKATAPMLAAVMADDDFRTELMTRLIEGECRRTLEAAMNTRHQEEKRRTGGGPLGATKPGRSSDLSGWAGAVQSALMDGFILPSGKKLGDADRNDLTVAMASFETVATDASVKHRWLRLIQQSVPKGSRVRDALTEERLAELRAEARKADA